MIAMSERDGWGDIQVTTMGKGFFWSKENVLELVMMMHNFVTMFKTTEL